MSFSTSSRFPTFLKREIALRARREFCPTAACLLALLLCFTPNSSAAGEDSRTPAYFQQLTHTGHVTFEYDDPAKVRRRFPGETQFRLRVPSRYDFQYETRRGGERRTLVITVDMKKATYTVEHTVLLPLDYDRDSRWESRLVRHEFDHVAISADPRLAMLAEHLVKQIRHIHYELKPEETADQDLVRQVVDREMQRRVTAVRDLVQANYRWLDQVSEHGAVPIPDRPAFFQSLYTKANLDQAGFPLTGESLELLRSPGYRELKALTNSQ